MATDEDTVDVIFKTLKVPAARGGAYGLNFRSSYPVMLADIDPDSPADKAGLKKGDFLVQLNGNDIQRSSEEAIRTIIKYSQGGQLSVRIARPHPFPSTDYLRRRAIITLQTKLAAGVADTNDEAADYQKTVESAFLEVQDILGSLGLGEDELPSFGSHARSVQEVEIAYHGDEKMLESPPDSPQDPFKVLDPLLDFGLNDDLTISQGKGGGASAGADLLKSTFEVQRALKGMKELTDNLNAAKEQKRLSDERGKVTTEATFIANFQSSSTNRTQQPSASPSSSSKSVPPLSSHHVNGVRERAIVHEQSNILHSERNSNGYERDQQNKRALVSHGEQGEPPYSSPRRGGQEQQKAFFSSSSSASTYQPKEDLATPPIPQYNPSGPEEFLLSNKPEYRQERKLKTNTYESVGDSEIEWVYPPSLNEYETVRDGPGVSNLRALQAHEEIRDNGESPPASQAYAVVRDRGVNPIPSQANESTTEKRSSSPPPPLPIRQHHDLSKTVSDPPQSSNKDKHKDVSLANVPLRSKKRGGNQSFSPAQEPSPRGHVDQRHDNGGRKMKYEVGSAVSSPPAAVKDVADVITACAGLPTNVHQWKKEEVGVWLRQMSPTLYNHYSSLFSKHDVTGRTLLRLNATKLQSLGVTTPAHCRILATEIMRVRIHQEANELRAIRK